MENLFQKIASPHTNKVTFCLAPTHVSYANTLVRLIETAVEVVAFRADILEDGSTSDVQVEANSTPMTNEMLAHRIGLLPVHIPNPTEWDPSRYLFVLDVVNASDEILNVNASDFSVFEVAADGSKTPVSSTQFFPPNPITKDTCLIARLRGKPVAGAAEEIRLKARATVGVGKEHARFIPTCHCAPAVWTRDEDPGKRKEAFDLWLQIHKKVDAAKLEQEPEKKAVLEREYMTMEVFRTVLRNQKGEPYSFDVTVESRGVLDPVYIVRRACETGSLLCAKFGDEGGTSLPDDVLVKPTEKRMLGYDFIFQNQDHTLGNLLQTWLDENLVGNGDITFAGYYIPHPLRPEMILTIGITGASENPEVTARNALKTAARACSQMFTSWSMMWSAATGGQTSVATAAASAQPIRRRILKKPTLIS